MEIDRGIGKEFHKVSLYTPHIPHGLPDTLLCVRRVKVSCGLEAGVDLFCLVRSDIQIL